MANSVTGMMKLWRSKGIGRARWLVLAVAICCAIPLRAQTLPAPPHRLSAEATSAAGETADGADLPHPTPTADGHWVGRLLGGIAALFVAAAVLGPILRMEVPEEMTPAQSHDEPPGASHRHGPDGTAVAEGPLD